MTDQEMYDQLAFYTLEQGRAAPSFIHQYIVDAYAAQHPTESATAIRTAFALVGLYLHIEKHYSGKQVQRAHMELAKRRKQWPAFNPPVHMGDITVADVLGAKPGAERDQAIEKWCACVWRSWSNRHQDIRDLVRTELGIA